MASDLCRNADCDRVAGEGENFYCPRCYDRLREENARLVTERDEANALFDARVPMGREDFTGKPLVERVRLLFSIRDSVGKLAGSLAEQIAPETLTALEQAEADRDRLRAALEQVEWVEDDGTTYCPWCYQDEGGYAQGGHAPDCPRQQALAETRAREE